MHKTIRKIGQAGLIFSFLIVVLIFSSSLLRVDAHAQEASLKQQSTGTLKRTAGKVIVVSLSHQWLYAYANGNQVFSAAVLTGRPELPTPPGTYHIFAKLSPTTFYSPFPKSSVYWYPPTHIEYALEFLSGYFLHDSWWHSVYGPGTNGGHQDPKYGWQSGSHGCVSMPVEAAAWLYRWAPIGTTVQINV